MESEKLTIRSDECIEMRDIKKYHFTILKDRAGRGFLWLKAWPSSPWYPVENTSFHPTEYWVCENLYLSHLPFHTELTEHHIEIP